MHLTFHVVAAGDARHSTHCKFILNNYLACNWRDIEVQGRKERLFVVLVVGGVQREAPQIHDARLCRYFNILEERKN